MKHIQVGYPKIVNQNSFIPYIWYVGLCKIWNDASEGEGHKTYKYVTKQNDQNVLKDLYKLIIKSPTHEMSTVCKIFCFVYI